MRGNKVTRPCKDKSWCRLWSCLLLNLDPRKLTATQNGGEPTIKTRYGVRSINQGAVVLAADVLAKTAEVLAKTAEVLAEAAEVLAAVTFGADVVAGVEMP